MSSPMSRPASGSTSAVLSAVASGRPSYVSYDSIDENNETGNAAVKLPNINERRATKRRTLRRATARIDSTAGRKLSLPIIVDAYQLISETEQLQHAIDENAAEHTIDTLQLTDNLSLQRKVNCSCTDCTALNTYLSSNKRRICFDIPVQRRTHVVQMISDYIGTHIIDVQSEWSGSRRVLWCRKLIDRAGERDYDSISSDATAQQKQHSITKSNSRRILQPISNNSRPTDRLLDLPDISHQSLHTQYTYWLHALGWRNTTQLVRAIKQLTPLDIHNSEVLDAVVPDIEEIYLGCVKHVIEQQYHNKYLHLEHQYNTVNVLSTEINELRIKTRFQYDFRHDIASQRLQHNVLHAMFHAIYGHNALQTIDDLFDVKALNNTEQHCRAHNSRACSRNKRLHHHLFSSAATVTLLDRLNAHCTDSGTVHVQEQVTVHVKTAEQVERELLQQQAIQHIIDMFNDRIDGLKADQSRELCMATTELSRESAARHQQWYQHFNKRYDVNNAYDYSLHALYDMMCSTGQIDASKRVLQCPYIPAELSYYPTFDKHAQYTDVYSLKQLHVCPSQISGTFADTQPTLQPMCFVLTLEPDPCMNIIPVQCTDLCQLLVMQDQFDCSTCTDSAYVNIEQCELINYNMQHCDHTLAEALYGYKRMQDEADKLQAEYDKQQAAMVKQQKAAEAAAAKQTRMNKQKSTDTVKRTVTRAYPMHTSRSRFGDDASSVASKEHRRLSTVSASPVDLMRQPSHTSQSSHTSKQQAAARRDSVLSSASVAVVQPAASPAYSAAGSRPDSVQHNLDTLTARKNRKNLLMYNQAGHDCEDITVDDTEMLTHRLHSTLVTIDELVNDTAMSPSTRRREHRRQTTVLLQTIQELHKRDSVGLDDETAARVMQALTITQSEETLALKQQLIQQLTTTTDTTSPISSADESISGVASTADSVIDMIVQLQQQQRQNEVTELHAHKRALTMQLQAELIQLSIIETAAIDAAEIEQLQRKVQATQSELNEVAEAVQASSDALQYMQLHGSNDQSELSTDVHEVEMQMAEVEQDEPHVLDDAAHRSFDVSTVSDESDEDDMDLQAAVQRLSASCSAASLALPSVTAVEQQIAAQAAAARAAEAAQVEQLFNDIFNADVSAVHSPTHARSPVNSVAAYKVSPGSSIPSRAVSRANKMSVHTLAVQQPTRSTEQVAHGVSVASRDTQRSTLHQHNIHTSPRPPSSVLPYDAWPPMSPSAADTRPPTAQISIVQQHRLRTADSGAESGARQTATRQLADSACNEPSTIRNDDTLVAPSTWLHEQVRDVQLNAYRHTVGQLRYIFNRFKWSVQDKMVYIRKYCSAQYAHLLPTSLRVLSHLAMLVSQRQYLVQQCQQLTQVYQRWFNGTLDVAVAARCKRQLDTLLSTIEQLSDQIRHHSILLHRECQDKLIYDGVEYTKQMHTDIRHLVNSTMAEAPAPAVTDDQPCVDVAAYFRTRTDDTVHGVIQRLHDLLQNQWKYAQRTAQRQVRERQAAVDMVHTLQHRASAAQLLHTQQLFHHTTGQALIEAVDDTILDGAMQWVDAQQPIAVLGREQEYRMLLYKATQVAHHSVLMQLQRQVAANVAERIQSGDVYDKTVRAAKLAQVEESKTVDVEPLITVTQGDTPHDAQWNTTKAKLAAKLQAINAAM